MPSVPWLGTWAWAAELRASGLGLRSWGVEGLGLRVCQHPPPPPTQIPFNRALVVLNSKCLRVDWRVVGGMLWGFRGLGFRVQG